MKKVILLVLVACLSLPATAAKIKRIDPARVRQAITEKGDMPGLLGEIRGNLNSLATITDAHARRLQDVPDLLPNLALAGFDSSDALSYIEEAYEILSKSADRSYLEVLAGRAGLHHGAFDFLNRFQAENKLSGNYWDYVNTLAREYGAFMPSHYPLRAVEKDTAAGRRIKRAENQLPQQFNEGPLGPLDNWSHPYTRAWLAEKGSPEEAKIKEAALKQRQNPLFHVKKTTQMLNELKDILRRDEDFEADGSSLWPYFIYDGYFSRDVATGLLSANLHTNFYRRYGKINREILATLKEHTAHLQKYLEHPDLFATEDISKEAEALRAQVYAKRAKLIAFIQYNMRGGTSSQHELYVALSDLADYYRFLQAGKIDVTLEFENEYSLPGVTVSGRIGRIAEDGNWAQHFLLEEAEPFPSAREPRKVEGITVKQMREQASQLSQELMKALSPFFDPEREVMKDNDFAKALVPVGDLRDFFMGMQHDRSLLQKRMMKEQKYVEYFFVTAYAVEVLYQDVSIQFGLSSSLWIPDEAFARQRYNKVAMAIEWLGSMYSFLDEDAQTDIPQLDDLLSMAEECWSTILGYNKSLHK